MSLENQVTAARFGAVEIRSDFECGAGVAFRLGDDGLLCIQIPEEPPVSYRPSDRPDELLQFDYTWYFCVALTNHREEEAQIPLLVHRDTEVNLDGFGNYGVPAYTSSDFWQWRRLSDAHTESENPRNYLLHLTVPAEHTVFVSNSIPRPYSQIGQWLRDIAVEHPSLCNLDTIGLSAEGRSIYVLTIGEPASAQHSRHRLLITSGFHPAEPDTLGTQAIVEYLLSDTPSARRIRKELLCDVVLQVNPDGFVHGTNGCNAHGVNMYWDFCRDDSDSSPEAVALWRWITLHPPLVYLDFHCYVHQVLKEVQPYIRPLTDYRSRRSRRLAARASEALIRMCDGRHITGGLTNGPATLAYQVTEAYDTVTFTKFHFHLKHGREAVRRTAVDVLERVTAAVRSSDDSRTYAWAIVALTAHKVRNKLRQLSSAVRHLLASRFS